MHARKHLVGAKERPVLVGFDTSHELVVDPQGVKEIARTKLLLAYVYACVVHGLVSVLAKCRIFYFV